jgi:hypothetical protein
MPSLIQGFTLRCQVQLRTINMLACNLQGELQVLVAALLSLTAQRSKNLRKAAHQQMSRNRRSGIEQARYFLPTAQRVLIQAQLIGKGTLG